MPAGHARSPDLAPSSTPPHFGPPQVTTPRVDLPLDLQTGAEERAGAKGARAKGARRVEGVCGHEGILRVPKGSVAPRGS